MSRGQSHRPHRPIDAGGTLLIKVASEAAQGKRYILFYVYGTDHPAPDGSFVRDCIHNWDLAKAHSDALLYLRRGGDSIVMNCGYSRSFCVLEVRLADRRPSDSLEIVAASDLIRKTLEWRPELDDLDLDLIVCHALDWAAELSRCAA